MSGGPEPCSRTRTRNPVRDRARNEVRTSMPSSANSSASVAVILCSSVTAISRELLMDGSEVDPGALPTDGPGRPTTSCSASVANPGDVAGLFGAVMTVNERVHLRSCHGRGCCWLGFTDGSFGYISSSLHDARNRPCYQVLDIIWSDGSTADRRALPRQRGPDGVPAAAGVVRVPARDGQRTPPPWPDRRSVRRTERPGARTGNVGR